MKLTIKTKLGGSLLILIIFIIVFGSYSVFTSQKIIEKTVSEESVSLIKDISRGVDRDFLFRLEQLEIYSNNPFLLSELFKSNEFFDSLQNSQNYIEDQDNEWKKNVNEGEISLFMQELNDADLSEVLKKDFITTLEEIYGHVIYGEAFVTNKYGGNIAQTRITSDYYQADEDWWNFAKENRLHLGDLEFDESSNIWGIAISKRLDDDKGNFIGVIKVFLSLADLVREAELSSKKYETTKLRIISSEGKLIYSSGAFIYLEDLSRTDFFQKIGNSNEGFFKTKEEGVEKLFSYTYSKKDKDEFGFEGIFVLSHDSSEILESVNNLRNVWIIFGSIMFLIIGILAFYLSNSISNPIKKLTEVSKSMSKGDFSQRLEIKTNDEIGELSSSFNVMAEDIKKSRKELEQRVKERTKDLEKAKLVLEKNLKELERFKDLTVGRELKMIDMKKEMDKLRGNEETKGTVGKEETKKLGDEKK